MTEKIAVLGAGSWGSILANLLVQNGYETINWTRLESQAKELNDNHTNKTYLQNFMYDPKLKATTDLKEALSNVDIILLSVPTQAIRSVVNKIKPILKEFNLKPIIINTSKGLELGTHKRISEIITEEIPDENLGEIMTLSGPSHAEEVARHDLTLITLANSNERTAKKIQDIISNDYFRIYLNQDIIGVELVSALKNVIALGAGMLSGLNYGDNARAALITRGLAELSNLGIALGADAKTFSGLAGMGDLIVTTTSLHSRNWQAGNKIAKGMSVDEVTKSMGMIIEGITSSKAAYEIAQQNHIEMPITEAIYNVLYNGEEVKKIIQGLMNRSFKSE